MAFGDSVFGFNATFGEGPPVVNLVVIGDITGYTKPYDQNFETSQAYKDSWTIPMGKSQEVAYTKAVKSPPTGDVFWGAYDASWLTVTNE